MIRPKSLSAQIRQYGSLPVSTIAAFSERGSFCPEDDEVYQDPTFLIPSHRTDADLSRRPS